MAEPQLACAVCFGGGDNASIALGLNWGIFILMSATVSIIAGLATAVYKIEKGRALEEHADSNTPHA